MKFDTLGNPSVGAVLRMQRRLAFTAGFLPANTLPLIALLVPPLSSPRFNDVNIREVVLEIGDHGVHLGGWTTRVAAATSVMERVYLDTHSDIDDTQVESIHTLQVDSDTRSAEKKVEQYEVFARHYLPRLHSRSGRLCFYVSPLSKKGVYLVAVLMFWAYAEAAKSVQDTSSDGDIDPVELKLKCGTKMRSILPDLISSLELEVKVDDLAKEIYEQVFEVLII